MQPAISVSQLSKVYDSGFQALHAVDLDIMNGEILALLGPNGAGKTTLISTICGITVPTGGSVTVDGHDIVTDFRAARKLIGLVPQEISLEPFEKVMNTVRFSRGLFGHGRDDAHLENVLRKLTLWDKRFSPTKSLSGGMKRRVLIAKALAHEPRILFLDEPTAGVDVKLRKDMWALVRELQADGVTIILTTHYIEEAEAIADRIGVINNGEILLVEEKEALMARLGRKQVELHLAETLEAIPPSLAEHGLELNGAGDCLVFTYDSHGPRTGITALLNDLAAAGLTLRDLKTRESSLEEIFVNLVAGEQT